MIPMATPPVFSNFIATPTSNPTCMAIHYTSDGWMQHLTSGSFPQPSRVVEDRGNCYGRSKEVYGSEEFYGSSEYSGSGEYRGRGGGYRGRGGGYRGAYVAGRGGSCFSAPPPALGRSPILPGSKYHAHHTGATLSCAAYGVLMRLLPRKTYRDPITREDFLDLLCGERKETEDLGIFRKWMEEVGILGSSVPAQFPTVCVPFLVGDCLPYRFGRQCKHGHPGFSLDRPLLGHPLVWSGGEHIRLHKGRVLVASIQGYNPANADRGLGGLILSAERDEGYRPCVWANCSRSDCAYFHSPNF